MATNLVGDTVQGIGGLAEYAPYVLMLGFAAIILVVVSVWTGSLGYISSLIGSAFWYVIGIMVFAIGALLTYENRLKERKPEREKAVIYSIVILLVLMLVLFNLPSLVNTAVTSLGNTYGVIQHKSGLAFQVTISNPGFFSSALGSQVYISNVLEPTIVPNKFTFAIPFFGILSDTITLNSVGICNSTFNPTQTPSINAQTPTGWTKISSASTHFSVSTISGGTQTVPINISNIPNNAICYYFFSLSGSNVNTQPYEYFYNIATQTGG